jgi:uncharacterized repeat protein (TIGR01451 family)
MMSSLESYTSRQAAPNDARLRLACLGSVAACVLLLVAVLAPGSARAAAAPSPQWTVTAMSSPTNFVPTPGSPGEYRVIVQNTGGAPSNGSTITVTDSLPVGLVAASSGASGQDQLASQEMTCTGFTCSYTGEIPVDGSLILKFPVEVAAGAPSSVTNLVTVTGGGASEAKRETVSQVSATRAGFGIAPGSVAVSLSTTQAGGHPDLTFASGFNMATSQNLLAGDPRNVSGDLPPGFAGDLADTPKCLAADFAKQAAINEAQGCQASAQVGTAIITLKLFKEPEYITVPVYNLTTNPGEIARLAFFVTSFGVEGTISLRPGDYGVRTTFQNIIAGTSEFDGISLTIWGVPSAPIHDPLRGRACSGFGGGDCIFFNTKGEVPGVSGLPSTSLPVPYLTSPTRCTSEPLTATLTATSWQAPETQLTETTDVGPLTGCNLLAFPPAITAAPDTTRADTPAGFTFGVKMVQEGLVSGGGIAASDVEDTTATLPVGVAINPGQANGLGACQSSQEKLEVEAPAECPSNSKVGQVEIETPILKNKLDGNVYLLQSNPPDVKLLVAPEDAPDGIFIKFVGDVHLNETTGQLVTTFEKTPQLPFSDLKLSFSGGAQAALATPTGCGAYTTNADFAPWSAEPDALVSSSFAIESGTGGSACASPLPFSPELIAGASTDQAGGFTHFSLLLQRADDQQRISTLQFKVPEGLLGMIAKVPLCGEPQAAQGQCSAASQIGHTVVEAGPGPYPLVVPQPGQPPAPIYLTGGYKGAPYGLSIVVPLVVGPFTLQTQIVRAKIEVNPLTAQLTVTTDPFPSIIDGIPADLRTINAVIDRPEFMFNPTSCAPMSFGGTATSTEGATQAIASHFQVGSCQSLKFQPNFKVSTSGKTSRTDGASLDAKIVYPSGKLGFNQASSQSNVKSVKVDLPRQLPSRLTTLQKACTSAQFESNPAGCPADSRVGEATAITPVLPVVLSGPAYFVSYGGAKFPELVVVLSGYGTTVQLHGETFISKAGITSSTFRNIPDVPITSFELKLPEGPDSALAANGNLCASKLTMPTAFVGQNGAEIHETTPISVTGCKPTVTVVRHSVKGEKVTIAASVPSAGKLVADGAGLSHASKSAGKAGTLTLGLTLSKGQQQLLSKHPGRMLKITVKLTFTPTHGQKLSGGVTVLIG